MMPLSEKRADDHVDDSMEEAFLRLEEAGESARQWLGRNFVSFSPPSRIHCEICKRASSTKDGSRHHKDDCPIQVLEDALEDAEEFCQDWR